MTTEAQARQPAGARPPGPAPRILPLGIGLAVLAAAYAWPLARLIRFAATSELYSYILLVPVIAAYLAWAKWKSLPARTAPATVWSLAFAGAALVALAAFWTFARDAVAPDDALAPVVLSFVLGVWSVTAWCVGSAALRQLAFPLGFLVLLLPMPLAMAEVVESVLQQGSAAAAYAMFKTVGTPLYYHDLIFQLPGIKLFVAPECSGIHSTVVLFILSLLSGYLFLRSPWKRTALAFAVLPLALLRNGFRVFTIGELCVHIGPEMIDSFIHRRGGPIFFLLSLPPFFLLLYYLLRSERRHGPARRAAPDHAS